MKKVSYKTKSVCSTKVEFELAEDGTLHNIAFSHGCDGNLKAIAKLCEGRPAREVAKLLKGNTCDRKNTSCADQFASAILSNID